MSFVLVEWVEEATVSIAPVSWVIEPTPLPSNFPVDGAAYWKRKSNKFRVKILGASDSKQELEELSRSIGSPSPPPLPPTLPQLLPQKRQPKTTKKKAAALVENQPKKQKKSNETKKAQAVATDTMADTILAHMSIECSKCKAKDEKIAELSSSLEDMQAAIHAKKAQIRNLESRSAVAVTTVPQTCSLPKPTEEGVAMLKNLVHYYESLKDVPYSANMQDNGSEVFINDNNMSDDNFSENESLCEYEKRCEDKRKENEAILSSLGLTAVEKQKKVVTKTACTSKTTAHVKTATAAKTGGPLELSAGKYKYSVTTADLSMEQEAFKAGEGKRELIDGYGVFIKFVDLEHAEQSSKPTATGLMRSLISVFYTPERLAGCAAKSGINDSISTVIFKYCINKFPQSSTNDLKRDLTNKCGEERRKLRKKMELTE